MRSRWYLAVLVLVPAVAALVAAQPQLATARDRDDLGREDVRHAVETGEIRSLADIIAAVRGKLPGEVAGVEIERKNGRCSSICPSKYLPKFDLWSRKSTRC
jgi:uncharacterized membrane protein YkoI